MLSCLLFITLFMPINVASAQVVEGKPPVELAESKDQKLPPVEEEEEGDDDC